MTDTTNNNTRAELADAREAQRVAVERARELRDEAAAIEIAATQRVRQAERACVNDARNGGGIR